MSKQAVRPPSKRVRRQERKIQRETEQRRVLQTKRAKTIGFSIAAVLIIVSLVYFVIRLNQMPVNASYPVTDAISCDKGEHSDFHIHAHLSIYINGKAVPVPAAIGIASDGSCIYWLHTHATDGVLHIEAPNKSDLTLGNFLDIWQEHFSSLGFPSQLSDDTGWQVYLNGKPSSDPPRSIRLQAHLLITLAYNSPGIQPDTIFSWNGL